MPPVIVILGHQAEDPAIAKQELLLLLSITCFSDPRDEAEDNESNYF